MAIFLDARIPLRFAPATPSTDSALLIEGDAPGAGVRPVARFSLAQAAFCHPAGCACCVPRGPVADALGQLFVDRARGKVAFFRDIVAVVSAAGEAAVRAVLADDPLVSARYRLGS